MIKQIFVLSVILQFLSTNLLAQSQQNKISVIAYYAGDANSIDAGSVKKLTHITFSFCHLKGNQLTVDTNNDAATIKHLVSLKKINPSLKVI